MKLVLQSHSVRTFPAVVGLLAICAFAVFGIESARAINIRVSQESAPGVGDFDNNILGFISSFATTDTTAQFYNFSGGFGNLFSYGNVNQNTILTVETSHLFMVSASDGLSMFVVHNRPNVASSDGFAIMRFDLSGDTAAIVVWDDPVSDPQDVYSTDVGGTQFVTAHFWGTSNTDGLAIGSLDGMFSMLAQFTAAAPNGLTGGWKAISDDGSTIPLALELDRRTRLDVVPEPSTAVILVIGALVLLLLRRQAARSCLRRA